MFKKCKQCGNRLPISYLIKRGSFCGECVKINEEKEAENRRKLENLKNNMIKVKEITSEQENTLKTLNKNEAICLYNELFNQYEADKELSEEEILVLQEFQRICKLSLDEIDFYHKLGPYTYLHCIRKENRLPTIDLHITGGGRFVLQKGEVIHYFSEAQMNEIKSVSLGYQGGSHGVSIPIIKGIRYRVGAHKGQLIKEDRLVRTSGGYLIITNKRVILHPNPGCKPFNLPLAKLSFYQCYQDGIEIFRDGREKGFFFRITGGGIDIIELCLNFILRSET